MKILSVYILTLIILKITCDWTFEVEDYINLKLSKHFVLSTKIVGKENPENLKETLKTDGVLFNIHLNDGIFYEIFLKNKLEILTNEKTKYFILEDNKTRIMKDFSYGLVEGFVTKQKYKSYVIGYFDDMYFYGKIQLLDKLFYIEKLKKYIDIFPEYNNSTENAIMFERAFILDQYESSFKSRKYHPYNIDEKSKNVFKRMTKDGNICSLLVVMDYSFLKSVHNMNINSATHHVLLSIDEADSLFRSTDFDEDGYPDNIGFNIKYLLAFEHFDNSKLIPKFTRQPMDGQFYMKQFSRLNLMSTVCLAMAFTGQSFTNNIIGISYSAVPSTETNGISFGGICDRPSLNPKIHLNTLVVSTKSTDGRYVPHFLFDLSLCHELGHSFGADHDSTKNCLGYLMTSHTPLDQNRKHFIFSSCSKKDILTTILQKANCFENDDTAYCGNQIRETTEECDCGTIRHCVEFDSCCTPHGRPGGCRVKREYGYNCHPSQGRCCTALCEYADLQQYGVECKNFEKTCPCKKKQKFCPCGISSMCIENTCNSEECTRIGLEECQCPLNLNITGCRTCCSSKKYPFLGCTLSHKITEFVLHQNQSTILKLRHSKPKNKNKKFGFFKTYCFGNECIRLFFKRLKIGNLCVLFGKLGDCKENNQCVTHVEPFMYKNTVGKKIGKSTVSTTSSSYFIVIIVCSIQYIWLLIKFQHYFYELFFFSIFLYSLYTLFV